MSLVNISRLEYRYDSHLPLVLKIDRFQVNRGETLFLHGKSGSGKTTLLELLAGILAIQTGEVHVFEKNLAQLKAKERDHLRAQKMGYIFQSFNLIPYLTAQENILLPLRFSNRGGDPESIKSEMLDLAEKLGIRKMLQQLPYQMSVGQQQRVAAARALLGQPELLLADEPTSSLDYDHREKFIQVLFDLCRLKKTTVMFVSHDQSLKHLFQRSVELDEINQIQNIERE